MNRHAKLSNLRTRIRCLTLALAWSAAGVTAPPAFAAEAGPSATAPAARAARQMMEQRALQDTAAEVARRAGAAARAAADAARQAEKAAAAAKATVAAAQKAARESRLAKEAAERLADDAARPKASRPTVRKPAGDALPRRARSKPTGDDRRLRPKVLRVGPGTRYPTPSAAARHVRDGDTVEIAGRVYAGDVAVWLANDLVLRGVGGRPHLKAAGRTAEGKAIWVIKGNNVVVENIEFSGASVADRNGAGIRFEGTNLTIRNSYFHGNQIGILTGHNRNSDVVIVDSEFSHNRLADDSPHNPGHNIYVGRSRSFTLRNSYVHHAGIGHNVKTRARINRILYNRLMDGREGNSSYIVDLSDGGVAYLIGNVIQQSAKTDNYSIISFGAERRSADDRLYIVSNTIVSDRSNAVFVQNRSPGMSLIMNNIFAGRGAPLAGPGRLVGNLIAGSATAGLVDGLLGARAREGSGALAGNLVAPHPGFRNYRNFDFRLNKESLAIDAGTDPGSAGDVSLAPEEEGAYPEKSRPRVIRGPIDIGAFEYRQSVAN